ARLERPERPEHHWPPRMRRDRLHAPRAPDAAVLRPRLLYPGFDPFGELPPLELSPGERDVVKGFAHRRGSVDPGLLEQAGAAPPLPQGLEGRRAVDHRAAGAIQLPDHDQVDLAFARQREPPPRPPDRRTHPPA